MIYDLGLCDPLIRNQDSNKSCIVLTVRASRLVVATELALYGAFVHLEVFMYARLLE
jgi:hypothetical protein